MLGAAIRFVRYVSKDRGVLYFQHSPTSVLILNVHIAKSIFIVMFPICLVLSRSGNVVTNVILVGYILCLLRSNNT